MTDTAYTKATNDNEFAYDPENDEAFRAVDKAIAAKDTTGSRHFKGIFAAVLVGTLAASVYAMMDQSGSQQTSLALMSEPVQAYDDSRKSASLEQVLDSREPHLLPRLQYPGDNCINLYQKKDYVGTPVTLCLPEGQTEISFSKTEIPEIQYVYSYWSGANIRYNIWNGNGGEATGINTMQGAGNNQNANTSASSVYNRVEKVTLYAYNPLDQGYVTLFSGENCKGRVGVFEAPSRLFETYYYNGADMAYYGMPVNDAVSVLVPYGHKLSLFYYDSWTGFEFQVDGGMFLDRDYAMKCVNLIREDNGDWWDDEAKSLKVYKSVSTGPAQGRYESITSTEPFEYTLSFGSDFESRDKHTMQHEVKFSLGLDFGIKFLADGLLNLEYTFTNIRETESLYKTSKSEALTVTCGKNNQDASVQGFGLHQWVIEDASGQNSVWHKHYFCKSGVGFNVPPACPPQACVNADCSVCTDDWMAVV